MQRKKMLLTVGLLTVLLTGGALAASFYFNFNQVPYNPSKYSWTAPWQVYKMVDFVEATLDLTGSGYESDPHSYVLSLKNVAPDSNTVLTNCTYTATWNNGTSFEVIASGSYNGVLFQNANTTYTGTFTPTLVGSGNINMTVSNIVWKQTQSITWTTSTSDPDSGSYIHITNFAVNCAKTYLPGTANFTLTWIASIGAYGYISWKLEIVELGNLNIGQQTDVYLDKNVPVNFGVPFSLTTGGALTMKLTLFNRHN